MIGRRLFSKHLKRCSHCALFIILFCALLSTVVFSEGASAAGTLTTVYLGGSGNDDYDGTSADQAVKSFAKAKSLLVTDGGTILICDRVIVEQNETWSLNGYTNAKVKRDSANLKVGFAMVQINSSATLTLDNIVFDGDEGKHKSYNTTKKSALQAMIQIVSGSVVMNSGAVLTNHYTQKITYNYGGAVTIENGGSLTMNPGSSIYGNTTANNVNSDGNTISSWGVAINKGGTFTINADSSANINMGDPIAINDTMDDLFGGDLVVKGNLGYITNELKVGVRTPAEGYVVAKGANDSGGTGAYTLTSSDLAKFIIVNENWYAALNPTDNLIYLTATDPNAASKRTITVMAGGNGAISPSTVSVALNGNQTFTITPNSGYCIDTVTVDDSPVASNDPNYSIAPATGVGAYTFRNVTADHSIAATFKPALSLDVELFDFGLVAAYSNEQPEKIITVKNNSDAAVEVPAPTLAWQSGGSYITVDQLYALDTTDMVTTLAAGATTTFIVKPQPGLPDGRWDLGVKGTVTLGTAKIVLKMITVCTATIDPDAVVGEHGTAMINTDRYPCVDGLYYGGGFNHDVTPAWSLVADQGYVVDSCTFIKVNKDGLEGEVIRSFAGQNLTQVDVRYTSGNEWPSSPWYNSTTHVIFKSATFTADTETYTITTSVGEDGEYNEGAITPVDNSMDENGVVSVIRNNDQSFTITPDAGYHIDKVYVDNQAVTVTPDPTTGIATYTFGSVNLDHTIAATFIVNSYTIAFDKNASDATGTMENMAMVYGTGAKLTANGFTRTDYTFAGWAAEPGGTVVYNDEAEVDIAVKSNNATITLYAVWTGGPVPPNPVYTVTPVEDAVYSIGSTNDGIKTMTVNTGSSGLKYFTVNISPVVSHSGDETAVFVHLRNGAQLELNATTADFDEVQTAIAGYNILPDDVVKIYVVDALSNALDLNPTILQ